MFSLLLRKAFSDYFEPTNVLNLEKVSHYSGKFIKKYRTLKFVNLK